MNDYERARQLAIEAEAHGMDLTEYVLQCAPDFLPQLRHPQESSDERLDRIEQDWSPEPEHCLHNEPVSAETRHRHAQLLLALTRPPPFKEPQTQTRECRQPASHRHPYNKKERNDRERV